MDTIDVPIKGFRQPVPVGVVAQRGELPGCKEILAPDDLRKQRNGVPGEGAVDGLYLREFIGLPSSYTQLVTFALLKAANVR